jgi:hypothetical protein
VSGMTKRCWVLAAVGMSACTHSVHINHTSDYRLTQPISDYRRVQAKAEQRVFFGLVTQTDYVNAAYADLEKTCPGGEVTGIQTRYSTSHGVLSWKNEVIMEGYCSK